MDKKKDETDDSELLALDDLKRILLLNGTGPGKPQEECPVTFIVLTVLPYLSYE